MKPTMKYSLLLGAALAAATAAAFVIDSSMAAAPKRAQAPMPAASSGASTYRGRGRLAERFLAEFDINKDGKVTHDEFNRTLAHEFSLATGKSPTMSLEQYSNVHLKDLRDRASNSFHHIDWKGDGKVTLDEYLADRHGFFESMDRDGTGVLTCGSSRSAGGPAYGSSAPNRPTRSGSRGAGSRGRASICYADDLNKDGKVTRAEFDKVSTQEFNAFAKGGSLTFDQYLTMQAAQSRTISARVFQRLDRDRDGTLTLQEFAAPQEKLFARLDKNNDGVVTQDELSSTRRAKRVASRN